MGETKVTDTAPDTGTETTTDETPEADTAPDLTSEVEKYKALARKHEDRAKANAAAVRELESLKQQTMSDTEKAIQVARAEARAEVVREYATKVVDAEVRAATAGRNIDVDALLDGLDRSRFVTEDGEPDRDAITAWVDRIAPKPTDPVAPDLGQGTRGQAAMALNGDPLLKSVIDKLKS